MTNWQDKYKDLEIGQVAWYWHKDKNTFWKWIIVKVNCFYNSKQAGCKEISIDSKSHYPYFVTEDFPNGPKCLTPDEV